MQPERSTNQQPRMLKEAKELGASAMHWSGNKMKEQMKEDNIGWKIPSSMRTNGKRKWMNCSMMSDFTKPPVLFAGRIICINVSYYWIYRNSYLKE